MNPTTPKPASTAELKSYVLQQAPKQPKKGITRFFMMFGCLLVLLWAFDGSKFNLNELIKGREEIPKTIERMLPPDFSKITKIEVYNIPKDLTLNQLILPLDLTPEQQKNKRRWWNNVFPQTIVGATIQTIQMALAGTMLALLFAFPISFLAATNTSPHPLVYKGIRFFLNLFRTIPDIALGLVFVSAVGLGAFAGTLALAVHTITVLAKLLSEAIENIDEGVVEAIRATGANYPQVLAFAVVPQMLPDLISFTLYRFETNIRAAAVLGLIGAGGIGYLLNNAFRTFQMPEAAAIVLILIVLVMGVDAVSARLRKLVI